MLMFQCGLHPTNDELSIVGCHFQGLDDAAAAAGDDGTSFAHDADSMRVAHDLSITAVVFAWLAFFLLVFLCVSSDSDDESEKRARNTWLICYLSCELVMTAVVVAVVVLILTTSQLNADHWESATGCKTEVSWDAGLNCDIASLAMLGVMNMYFVCCPTPEEHKHEPSWFERRVLALSVFVD